MLCHLSAATAVTPPDLTGGEWVGVGAPRFTADGATYPALALAPDGTPFVAYSDGGLGGKLSVRKLAGSDWVSVGTGGFSAGLAEYVNLVFAPNGTPHVAFLDWANGAKATVMQFDGSQWRAVGSPGLTSARAEQVRLAFAPDGTPYLAYRSWKKPTVQKFNGTSWTVVGNPEFAGTGVEVDGLSLAIGPTGVPYVAFAAEANRYRATVMKLDGSTWRTLGAAGFSPQSGAVDPSLVFAPDGTLHVAFGSLFGSPAVMKFAGGQWVAVGTANYPAQGAFKTSLAFAADGTPHVAFVDWYQQIAATVIRYDGAVWAPVGDAGLSADRADETRLAFGPDGTPYVAYVDRAGELAKVTVQKLVPPTTFARWADAHFSAADLARPEVSGPLADPDGAGVSNLLRFACGLPARGPVAMPPVGLTTVTEGGAQYPALRFSRRSVAPGLRYTVQASNDLVTWTDVSTWTADPSTVVTARDAVALGSSPRRFLRLRVVLP